MTRYELVVVGAGAMGAATAWHGARLAGGDVLVLERGAACSGTSALGAGLVNRLLHDPLEIAWVDRSIELLTDLGDQAGRAFTYHDPGGLLFTGPQHDQEVERLHRVWAAQGLAVAEVDLAEVRELPGCQGLTMGAGERAWFVEGDGWCVTTDAVRAMLAAATEHGADVRTRTPVAQVDTGGVVLAGGERVDAGAVVVAAGVWTPGLFAPDAGAASPWHPPLVAYRPQALTVRLDHGAPGLPTVHDVPHHAYWRPDGPGKVLVGDGTVLEPQDPTGPPPVEPHFAEDALAALATRWPAASKATLVRAWAGYEAATPDRHPLVGPVPGVDGVHVCAGGNGFGFMRAPALGEAAACTALGHPPRLAVGRFDPDRFDPEDVRGFRPREGFSWGRADTSHGGPEGS